MTDPAYTQLYQQDPMIYEIYQNLCTSTKTLSEINYHQLPQNTVLQIALERKHVKELQELQQKLWHALQTRDATAGLRKTDIAGMVNRLQKVPSIDVDELMELKRQTSVTMTQAIILNIAGLL